MAKSSFVERNKAVRKAWIREQELVQKGQGTREWTPEQQKDILEKGRAYDENGKAFEGQHMKSAEQYPEYQGEPGNIQFLTRLEHLEAHDGNWQNPSNWYFDPVTKEKIDFGDGTFIPCKIISLPEPVVKLNVEVECDKKSNIETMEKKVTETPHSVSTQKENLKTDAIPKSKVAIGEHIKNAFRVCKKAVVEFPAKHPKVLELCGIVAATIVAEVASESSKNNSSNSEYRNIDTDSTREYNSSEELEHIGDDNYSNDDVSESSNRPYTPNDVPAGKQRYHYKDGSVRWKDKPSYHRDGKKEE